MEPAIAAAAVIVKNSRRVPSWFIPDLPFFRNRINSERCTRSPHS